MKSELTSQQLDIVGSWILNVEPEDVPCDRKQVADRVRLDGVIEAVPGPVEQGVDYGHVASIGRQQPSSLAVPSGGDESLEPVTPRDT